MPRFRVDIQGEGLERALAALNGAGIPTIGPFFTGRPGSGEEWIVGKEMHAVIDADAPEQAEARVKQALPADSDFTVAKAEPLKQPD